MIIYIYIYVYIHMYCIRYTLVGRLSIVRMQVEFLGVVLNATRTPWAKPARWGCCATGAALSEPWSSGVFLGAEVASGNPATGFGEQGNPQKGCAIPGKGHMDSNPHILVA